LVQQKQAKTTFKIRKRGFNPGFEKFLQIYGKSLAMLLIMLLGIMLPQAAVLSFLLKYLLILLLFLSFLDIKISRSAFDKSLLLILTANIGLAFAEYFFLKSLSQELALSAFITAITPTAIAAPVIVNFIKGKVEYTISSVLINNLVIAILLPFILPLVAGRNIEVSSWIVFKSVATVMFLPLMLSGAATLLPAQVYMQLKKTKSLTFPVWMSCLFLITAKASSFVFSTDNISASLLLKTALVALMVCIINYGTGKLIGGKKFGKEASVSLGQKNTAFTIWLSLTFLNPLVAMGPTFYVIYHNSYNLLLLYFHEKKNRSLL